MRPGNRLTPFLVLHVTMERQYHFTWQGSKMRKSPFSEASCVRYSPETSHFPCSLHCSPSGHIPQVPPQPSFPHSMSSQYGVQHVPSSWQTLSTHSPQIPPAPSGPHSFPVQTGGGPQDEAFSPQAMHVPPTGHWPQLFPHPSSPHCFAFPSGQMQLGTDTTVSDVSTSVVSPPASTMSTPSGGLDGMSASGRFESPLHPASPTPQATTTKPGQLVHVITF